MVAKLSVVEATIEELQAALGNGTLTSVELVARYLNRIARYDRHGLRLNAVPILNSTVFEDAAASDRRRAAGEPLRPLEGIPFTVKDSYKVAGLTVASGSPAFQHVVSNEDAFTVARLREAGAVLIGKTTMPPMADGGMERGVYGRAESPYNLDFLTAAYASGSSNGSGTATAASFAAFGLGEETLSSGRSPASNNALVAYTPSRGLISVRGNWPLFPTCDVVVPHTRTVTDLFALLDVLVVEDPVARGDFWREQDIVVLPSPADVRPSSFGLLADRGALAGKRIGVPAMYIGTDEAIREPLEVRPSILELWYRAAGELQALGATIVEVDFPVVSHYDRDRDGMADMYERGLVPLAWQRTETLDLIAYGWEGFLAANADPRCSSLADIDPAQIFPTPPGAIPDRLVATGPQALIPEVCAVARTICPLTEIPDIAEALPGLEKTRTLDFEDWLDSGGLDFVVFPANADVGKADSDVDQESNDHAWQNGVLFSNGNLAIRHLGIPSVTVPMGIMGDIGMPVGLTFVGKAYSDNDLLRYAYAYEQATRHRKAPPLTPPLESETLSVRADATRSERRTGTGTVAAITERGAAAIAPVVTAAADLQEPEGNGSRLLVLTGTAPGKAPVRVSVTVNGCPAEVLREGNAWRARVNLPAEPQPGAPASNPVWDAALVVVLAEDETGLIGGTLLEVEPPS